MEESDSPQGFQVFTDNDNGFGGLAVGILENIQDDYSKKSIHTIGFSSQNLSTENALQRERLLFNSSLSLRALSEISSVYVPISVPNYKQYGSKPWAKYLNCDVIFG